MASLIGNCLGRLVSANRISQKQADDALALHEGIQDRLYPTMGPASAEAASALEAARTMAQAAREKQLAAAHQAIRYRESLDRMELHPNGKTAGLQGILTRDNYEAGAKTGNALNIDSHSENVVKRLLGIIDGSMHPYASKMAGLSQDTESVWNIVRELFGKDTGDDAAKAAAKGWKDATDYAVDRVKRSGKRLAALEDWRLPQLWNGDRMKKFSQQEFVGDLMREFEAGNMRVMDKAGYGEAPRGAVSGIIANAYDDIKLSRGVGNGSGAFSNSLRTFRFDDPEAYIRMMQKYGMGNGGLYNTMMGHLGAASREISLVELLGPQYESNFKNLLKVAAEDDQVRNNTIGKKIKRSLSLNSPAAVQNTFDAVTGKIGVPQSELIAGIGGGLRNIKTAANLGSAVVSALPGDSFTAAMAARYNDIPATAVLARTVRDLTTNREGAEALARQINLTAHSVIDHALGSKRFSDQVVGDGLTGRVADTVMRVTGINVWTEGIKRAFSMEFNGMIARESEKAFGALDPSFRKFLDRYGFKSDDWDKLRATPPLEADGAKFFNVNAVEDQKLADRLMSAIIDERHFAVIEPDARIRGAMTMGTKRGTILGEAVRSASQFKSFPVSFMMTHMMRTAVQDGNWGKVSAGVKLLALTTIAGAVTAQMQSLIAGEDPLNMKDPHFWLQAFLRGGGSGMAGDLAYSASTRGGEGISQYLAGPVPGEIMSATGDLAQSLANSKTYQAIAHKLGYSPSASGDKALTGKMLSQHIKAWVPGSSLWYTKIATDRLLFDFIQQMADPQYRQSFQRYQQRLQKDYGQKFWWAPGEGLPKRGPNFGAAVGQK
jgi:hypothetical protein